MPRLSTKISSTGGGSSTPVDLVDAKTTHGAVGNGIADDSAAIQAAINAAASSSALELFLPPGTYRLATGITGIPGNLKIRGQKATIKWDSKAHKAFSFASGASNITIEGVTFEGDTVETDFNINQYEALFFANANVDVTIRECVFSWCRAFTVAGTIDMHNGRMHATGCKFLNNTVPIALPSNSRMSDCWFVNDQMLAVRSHAIYVFGEAENVVITGCFFKNIDGDAIKFNNAAARFEHKRRGVISNNTFVGGGSYCIWIGSDGEAIVSGFVVTGNLFLNTKTAIHTHNASDVSITDNTVTWDWEVTSTAGSVTGAIEISSAVVLNVTSPARNVLVANNVMTQRHPFVGIVTFTAVPSEDATLTVGSTVYTWKSSPVATTDIQRPAAAGDAARNAMLMIRGSAGASMNAVLRGPDDAFYEDNTAPATDPVLVVASDTTFTLSTTGTGSSVTSAVADRRVCASALHIDTTHGVTVRGNTFDTFTQAYVTRSVEPIFENNTLVDCVIAGFMNIRGRYCNNTFKRRRGVLASQSHLQQIQCSDGWPIIIGNRLTYNQHYTCTEMLGGSGVVTVSDGRSYADLYYGSEAGTGTGPESIPFRWSNGDTVQIRDPYLTVYTCTFKRSSPGANEFNSAASLLTWLNAISTGGGFTAAYLSTTNFSADVWIRITHSGVYAAGDNCYVKVTTRSQICGQLLIDTGANAPEDARRLFRGGNDGVSGGTGATRTWCWTQLANQAVIPRVHGTTSASRSLSPRVYAADILPGVGFYITHDASVTGAEKFAWCIEAP